MNVLVIEDEPNVASFIKEGLEEVNYKVTLAYDGEMGKRLASDGNYDIIILDVILPKINGIDLCKMLREMEVMTPILMLTALGASNDKVTGLEAGADDYLVKPFDFSELIARIKALSRRQRGIVSGQTYKIADLSLNLDAKVATRAGKALKLTPRELALLEVFMKNQGKVLSRLQLAEKVWNVNFDTRTNVVDVYVNYLRNKVDKGFSPKLIHTVVGLGYMMKVEND